MNRYFLDSSYLIALEDKDDQYYQAAIRHWNSIKKSVPSLVTTSYVFDEGWSYFKKHTDKSYSFTDCVSFILMKKLDMQTAFGFDKHFIQAGFSISPS